MIVIFAIFFITILTERFIRGHTWQLKGFHQTVHSADTDVNAIITLKNTGNFISTKTLVVISMNLQNKPGYLLILFGATRWLRIVMLVISTSVDTQNPAEGFDVMLEAELMNRF